MSDGALSQDEIDALMSGSSMGGFDFGGGASNDDSLSENDKQAFLSLVNSIIDTQSATLSGMMGKKVTISPPSLELVDGDAIAVSFDGDFVKVTASFSDGLTGYHAYLFTEDISKAIAGLLSGLEQVDLDDAALSAVSEAVNTVAGSAMTTYGNKIGETVMTEPANAEVVNSSNANIQAGNLVKLNYPITIEGYEPAVFNELFDISVVSQLVEQSSAPAAPSQPQASAQPAQMQSQPAMSLGNMDNSFGAPGQGGGGGYSISPNPAGGGNQGFVNIQNIQYPSLSQGSASSEQGNISLLMDVNMEMTVELGRTKKPIREILSMGEGTIIELDKLAGEPVDILVNHKLIANGEVVVIDENFGVRVTKIVSNPAGVNDMT